MAAKFTDGEAAARVLGELRDAYDLDPNDAALAPLGTAGSPEDGVTLLAGRFWEERVPRIRELVEQNGGSVVVDVDEAATRSRATPAPTREAEARRLS